MKITKIFVEFFESEKSSGLILLGCTILSLVLANSIWSEQYIGFWHTSFAGHSLAHWINDGLMAIFFLLVGFELEREIYIGELSSPRNAVLPIVAAFGGMIVPAGIHAFFNYGTETQSGFGIPMATDIAFSLGVLSLFSRKVPFALKIFLTALAIADDLGAVLVIAVFYTNDLSLINLGISLSIYAVLIIMGRLKVYNLIPYLVGGVAMWYFMLHSGVHATITGVLLAFAIPFGKGDDTSPSYKMQHFLHKPVAWGILPIFALANTCIIITSDWHTQLLEANSLGIFFGLVVGKPIGILLFCAIAIVLKVAVMPENVSWRHLAGAAFLAGIGFTMSIFVSILAFEKQSLVDFSQITILIASLVAGLLGTLWFKLFVKPVAEKISNE